MVETCVQTMKASLIKTMEEGEDMDLALLTYKTTPLSHRLPLPAELLNFRNYKSLLPTQIVPTRLQESYRQIMDQGEQVQAQLYNKTPECYQDMNSLKKLLYNWIQTETYGHWLKSSNAQPMKTDPIV